MLDVLLCVCLRARLCMDFTLVPVLGDGKIWQACVWSQLTCDWPEIDLRLTWSILWSHVYRLKALWSCSAATQTSTVRKGESIVDSLASALALALFHENCMIQVSPTWILYMSPPTHQIWSKIILIAVTKCPWIWFHSSVHNLCKQSTRFYLCDFRCAFASGHIWSIPFVHASIFLAYLDIPLWFGAFHMPRVQPTAAAS